MMLSCLLFKTKETKPDALNLFVIKAFLNIFLVRQYIKELLYQLFFGIAIFQTPRNFK